MLNTSRQPAGKICSLTSKKAYLIGVYLGDGCVSFVPKHGNYFFSLNAIDKEFVEKTSEALEEFYDKKTKIFIDRNPIKRNQKPLWKVVVYGKKKSKELRDITHDKMIIPECILKTNKEIQKWFIAGVMDSEGYVGKHTRNDGTHQYLCGIASTAIWFEDFIELLIKHGVKVGKRQKYKRPKSHLKVAYGHKINTMSWINSGCFFTIKRKNNRLVDYIKSLSPQRLNALRERPDDIVRTLEKSKEFC